MIATMNSLEDASNPIVKVVECTEGGLEVDRNTSDEIPNTKELANLPVLTLLLLVPAILLFFRKKKLKWGDRLWFFSTPSLSPQTFHRRLIQIQSRLQSVTFYL